MNPSGQFGALSKKLKSSKILEKRELHPYIGEELKFCLEGIENEILKFYQISENNVLATENFNSYKRAFGHRSSLPLIHSETRTQYYLFKDDKPVINPDEIKKIINETMGIKLSSLNFENSGLFCIFDAHKFVTSIESDKEHPDLEFNEEQPNEEDISRGIMDAKQEFDKMPRNYGFKNTSIFLKNIKSLEEVLNIESEKYKKQSKHRHITI